MKKLLLILIFLISCSLENQENKDISDDYDKEIKSELRFIEKLKERDIIDSNRVRILKKSYIGNEYSAFEFVEIDGRDNSEASPLDRPNDYIELYHKSKRVFEWNSSPDLVLHIDTFGEDVNGNGIKDMIITQSVEGDTAFTTLMIFELGNQFRKLLEMYTDDPIIFKDIDGDGIGEVIYFDGTFDYWHASHGDSPMPRYILKFTDGFYRLATELMRKPPPSRKLLEKWASETELDEYSWESDVTHYDNPELFKIMLDLIYSGNMSSAWEYLDLTWSKKKKGKEQFKRDFMKQLRKSEYWDEINRMNKK